MAFKLMGPIYDEMPYFQPNQVLTYEHLNDLAGFLAQQEHYTRNKLIGSGIVCGLSFEWVTLTNPNAKVIIQDGCANTSAGYMVVFKMPTTDYTHKRVFSRLNLYPPFDQVLGNETIYELITLAEYNAEIIAVKDILLENDRTNRVLIILLEPEVKNPAKCLDENCDDKGKVYLFTPRPLLVPMSVLDKILDAINTTDYYTEEGRGWKRIDSLLQGTNMLYSGVPNLFNNSELQTINNATGMQNLFKNRLQDSFLDMIKDRINALLNAFPWMFSVQLAALKSEMPALTPPPGANLGDQFKANAQAFRNNAGNNNYIQYLYDFVRDVSDAYNALFTEATELISECGGNEFCYPYHIMLGRTQANDDSVKYYEENKYLNPGSRNFRYRHYFVPSPLIAKQFTLFERVQQYLKRLVRIINNFTVNPADNVVKISPSFDYDRPLSVRAIPYYYQKNNAGLLRSVWNYESTSRNKIKRHNGYQLAATQDELLANDTAKYDFYRVEGHVNSDATAAVSAIDTLRKKYNLPFMVTSVSIQSTTNANEGGCTYPDLEEDFNYYRDRVLGYLREYMFQLNTITSQIAKDILALLEQLANILKEIRCVEKFPYQEYKKIITRIYELIFKYYVTSLGNNTGSATQQLNSALNILNIIFFRPIYRIWYSYLYRVGLLTSYTTDSLSNLSGKYTGLEHLAGVRRGETLLLVYDTAQANKVVADFNIPDYLSCSCDCKVAPCNGSNKSNVPPMEKPIIMVVDYNNTSTSGKNKAFFVQQTNEYRLELDSMGFYKGDTTIDPEVRIFEDPQGSKPFNRLVGRWLPNIPPGNKLQLNYKRINSQAQFGIRQLYYHLKGDSDPHEVVGMIFLIVMGTAKTSSGSKIDIQKGATAKPVYPYNKSDYKNTPVDLNFPINTGDPAPDQTNVYQTKLGNQVKIQKDKDGYAYFMSTKSAAAGIEEVPYILSANGNSVQGTILWNVIDRNDKMESSEFSGILRDAAGQPIANARVTTAAGEEAFTNDNGEFHLAEMKAGDVITIEKDGFQNSYLKVNSKMQREIKMNTKPIVNVPSGLKSVLPGKLADIATNFNITNIRNIFKNKG